MSFHGDVLTPDRKAAVCDGKHPFESPTLALSIAKRSKRRRQRNYSTYRCPACNKWHLGTRRGWANPKKSKRKERLNAE